MGKWERGGVGAWAKPCIWDAWTSGKGDLGAHLLLIGFISLVWFLPKPQQSDLFHLSFCWTWSWIPLPNLGFIIIYFPTCPGLLCSLSMNELATFSSNTKGPWWPCTQHVRGKGSLPTGRKGIMHCNGFPKPLTSCPLLRFLLCWCGPLSPYILVLSLLSWITLHQRLNSVPQKDILQSWPQEAQNVTWFGNTVAVRCN